MQVEDAIQLATDTVKKLFAGREHRLEEIELKSDGDFDVTVSFRAPDAAKPMTLGNESFLISAYDRKAAIGIDPTRTYKDVLISKDGVVKAVRMRQIVVG